MLCTSLRAIYRPSGRTLAEASVGGAVLIAEVSAETVAAVPSEFPFLADRRARTSAMRPDNEVGTVPSNPRVALVTGAARGIGRACAVALAREGYAMVLAGRDYQSLVPWPMISARTGARPQPFNETSKRRTR